MSATPASSPAWNEGRPGASARAEYERRLQREDAQRRARYGRHVGAVVGALLGPNATTTAWARGGQGEEAVGRSLTRAVGATGVVLHDRSIPGSRANIDHLVIVPSGVWVVDTKRYRGRVQQRRGWFGASPMLFVHGHNRTNLVVGAVRQRQLVQKVLEVRVPVHAALCFVDAEWGLFARPFAIDGVEVTWCRRLASSLLADGDLHRRDVMLLAAQLDEAFPAYAPSGTSQSPTGA